MTSNQNQNRNDVLFAFHQAYSKPSAQQIIDWVERYPQFAEDIRAHAAVSYDWAANENATVTEPTASQLAAAFSRALSALYDAEIETAAATGTQSTGTLHDMLSACGKTIPAIQKEIGHNVNIMRCVLADMFNGGMAWPISKRLHDSMVRALSTTADQFRSAFEQTLNSPRMSHASAAVTPVPNVRSCEEIIRTSGMSPIEVSYWLDEE